MHTGEISFGLAKSITTLMWLKIPKGKLESVYGRRTDNTMDE